MPEGDTIHRAASRLRPALVGAEIERFSAPRHPPPHPKSGETVESVEVNGKHLLIAFSGGLTLHTHLGMTGTWMVRRRGERWTKPRHLARAVITTAAWEAVCFAAPTVRLTPTSSPPDALARLGPDLALPTPDLDEALQRMASISESTSPAIDVLLDQRVAGGVGNVFKSEVLWACRVHPLTPIGDLDDAHRRDLLEMAARQLRRNLGSGRRTTVGSRPGTGQLAVYRRHRKPCLRCRRPIEMAYLGRDGRSTYWCPACQPAPTGTGASV